MTTSQLGIGALYVLSVLVGWKVGRLLVPVGRFLRVMVWPDIPPAARGLRYRYLYARTSVVTWPGTLDHLFVPPGAGAVSVSRHPVTQAVEVRSWDLNNPREMVLWVNYARHRHIDAYVELPFEVLTPTDLLVPASSVRSEVALSYLPGYPASLTVELKRLLTEHHQPVPTVGDGSYEQLVLPLDDVDDVASFGGVQSAW